jgi:hypothetical protein
MATAIRSLGNICLFLAGLAFGVVLTLVGTVAVPYEDLSAVFLFPNAYYALGTAGMVGLSVLLRKAADRIV